MPNFLKNNFLSTDSDSWAQNKQYSNIRDNRLKNKQKRPQKNFFKSKSNLRFPKSIYYIPSIINFPLNFWFEFFDLGRSVHFDIGPLNFNGAWREELVREAAISIPHWYNYSFTGFEKVLKHLCIPCVG